MKLEDHVTRGLAADGAGAGVLRTTFYLQTGGLDLQHAISTLCPSEETSLLSRKSDST